MCKTYASYTAINCEKDSLVIQYLNCVFVVGILGNETCYILLDKILILQENASHLL